MLKVAKNEFKKNKNIRVFTITADELLLFFGFGEKNHKYLKKELEILNNTKVIYNFLGKDFSSRHFLNSSNANIPKTKANCLSLVSE
jgi:hypothetical protein